MANVKMRGLKTAPANLNTLPREFMRLPKAGSRPRDKYDEMYKRRVIAGHVLGDEAFRKQEKSLWISKHS
jgi:hypothetical protein